MSKPERPWWENGTSVLAAGGWITFFGLLVAMAYGMPRPWWGAVAVIWAFAIALMATAMVDLKRKRDD